MKLRYKSFVEQQIDICVLDSSLRDSTCGLMSLQTDYRIYNVTASIGMQI